MEILKHNFGQKNNCLIIKYTLVKKVFCRKF